MRHRAEFYPDPNPTPPNPGPTGLHDTAAATVFFFKDAYESLSGRQ